MPATHRQIGILDIQGGVHEHIEHFRELGVDAVRVKHAEQLASLSGLVIPGGESTCLARLLRIFGIDVALLSAFSAGMKVWGTCAGTILVAQENVGESPHLGLIDIAVERNAFGSQLDSFRGSADVPELGVDAMPLTFIRAPKIVRVGEGVRVLLQLGDYIAAAEDERVLVSIFHPELTDSLVFHRHFAEKCGFSGLREGNSIAGWSRKSWMADA